MRDVLAAGTVATLAAHIPFRNLLSVDVVTNRVAAVTGWTCWTFHVVGRIELRPPVCTWTYEVFTPLVILDLPLDRQGEVIVAQLGEVTLLPNTAVNKCHLIA